MPAETLPEIRGFIRNSLNEWDGRLSCVVFLPGCNYRCPFCHGWRFVTDRDSLPLVPFEEVEAYLDENDGWVDGVVVTGGEPTIQRKLGELLHRFRDRNLEIKLHTNGSMPGVVRVLLLARLVNCVALDYKAPLRRDPMRRAAGPEVDAEAVRETFIALAESDVEHEFHTTLCPACIKLEDLSEMAELLREIGATGKWYLQQYNPGDVLDAEAAGSERFDIEDVESVVAGLRSIYEPVEVRGFTSEPAA